MKICINFKLCAFILLIFPFIKPNYFIHIDVINNVYNILQIINFLIILVLYIKDREISKQLIIVTVMQIALVFTTVINDGEIIDLIKSSIQIISFSMIIEYLMKKDIKTFFRAITIVLCVLLFANFITILYKPDGFLIGYLKKWLFGTKNNHFSLILPCIMCSYIYYKYIRNNTIIKFLIILSISIISIFIMQSATSLVAMIILLAYFLFYKFLKVNKKINAKAFMICYLLLFIGVIVFQVQNNFSYIIEDVLNKDLTFTGRTDIWKRAIDFIEKSPIIGYGNESNIVRVFKFNSKSSIHCHNMILEIIYQGGIIFTFLFTYFIKIIINKIKLIENKELYNFVIWVLLVYCIALFTEVYSFEVIIWVMMILCNIYKLVTVDKEKIYE